MKTKHIIFSLLIAGCFLFASCDDKLDIEQHGVSTVDSFYETDDEAEQAVIACYSAWREIFWNSFAIKNSLSDECYASGGSWTDSNIYIISTYTFDASNSYIEGLFSNLYAVVYAANVVLENVDESSDIKGRARAEARVFRAMAYFELITLWGTPPLVDHNLGSDEYNQPNGDTSELWALVNEDLTEAINSGYLEEKSDVDTYTYRITKQFAQALLGKAYVFQEDYSSAASVLDEVIESGKYALVNGQVSDTNGDPLYFDNVLTTRGDGCCESLFEINYVIDAANLYINTIWTYGHWRGSFLSFNDGGTYSQDGWGYFSPSTDSYDAFVEMGDTYRLSGSIRTLAEMEEIGISISSSTEYMPDNVGYFDWKYRVYAADVYNGGMMFCPANTREMRYAEVLLLAAEAYVQTGNTSKALDYINQVRDRAQLPSLTTVTMDDIKKERQCELWLERCRYQDLVRWGDAASVLADRGKQRPAFYPDGTVSWDLQTNSSAGFVSGKHELLPFPTTEMNVNTNLVQNPGY